MKQKQIKIPKKVENYLEKIKAKCELIEHRTVYTAFDKAATLKVNPGAIAKILVIKLDGVLAMAAIGGDKNLDMDKLLKLAKAKKIDFANEKIIGAAFKGIDPGAIPPFSGLWNIEIFCDRKLLESPKIIISAGSYEYSIKLAPGTCKKLSPDMIVGNISKAKDKKPKPTKKIAAKSKPTKKRK